MERAEAAGLAYVGDTDVSSMLPGQLEPDVAGMLENVPLLRQEQYRDFIQNRMFRGSLLCHREVTPQPRVDSLRLSGCAVGLEG
jgi:methyltransferase-like protein